MSEKNPIFAPNPSLNDSNGTKRCPLFSRENSFHWKNTNHEQKTIFVGCHRLNINIENRTKKRVRRLAMISQYRVALFLYLVISETVPSLFFLFRCCWTRAEMDKFVRP